MCLKKEKNQLQPLGAESGGELPLMESFLSVQGEGMHTGRLAWFIRLAGCGVGCHWCDVKESWSEAGYARHTAQSLANQVPKASLSFVVVTGGEPLGHGLGDLCKALHAKGLKIHLETSGVGTLSGDWDWICLSPKKRAAPTRALYTQANELKVVVYNRDDLGFAQMQAEEVGATCACFLQPEWSRVDKVMPWIIDLMQKDSRWRLSLQTHKYLSLP